MLAAIAPLAFWSIAGLAIIYLIRNVNWSK